MMKATLCETLALRLSVGPAQSAEPSRQPGAERKWLVDRRVSTSTSTTKARAFRLAFIKDNRVPLD